MVDLVDIVQENESRRNDCAVRQVLAKFAYQKPTEKCVDCDSEIDADRRKACPNACRCLECAEFFELQKR